MKIKDILKIESIIDKRATPSDVLEHLDTHIILNLKMNILNMGICILLILLEFILIKII